MPPPFESIGLVKFFVELSYLTVQLGDRMMLVFLLEPRSSFCLQAMRDFRVFSLYLALIHELLDPALARLTVAEAPFAVLSFKFEFDFIHSLIGVKLARC